MGHVTRFRFHVSGCDVNVKGEKMEKRTHTTEPCFSWLNPGQIVIHRAAFGPLQPAVVGILSNDGIPYCYWHIGPIYIGCVVIHLHVHSDSSVLDNGKNDVEIWIDVD